MEERKRKDNAVLEKLRMELEFKTIQSKLEADRTASGGEVSHEDRHLSDVSSSVRTGHTRIRCPILSPEKD